MQLLKGLGLSSIVIILVGLGGEALFVVVDAIAWVVERVRSCKKRNKVENCAAEGAKGPKS